MTSWKPIETAPTDGSKFIAWDGKYPMLCQRGKYYVKWPHQEGGPTYEYKWNEITSDSITPCDPTHWMPLPSFPQ